MKTALVINDTTPDRHHGCSRVMAALGDLLRARGVEVIHRHPVGSDWRESAQAARAMGEADLVVVNGEGTIHHDRPAGAALLAVGAEARRLGKRAALVNMTWAENGPAFVDAARAFDILAVRESRSAATLASAGLAPRLCVDLSLYRPAPTQPPGGGARAGELFTDSVLPEITLGLEALRARRRGALAPIFEFGGGLAEAPRHLLFRVRALPTARWRAPAYMAAERRAASPTPDTYLERLAGAALLVTGRFHATCFALATETPVLAVETNTWKTSALIQDAGLDPMRDARIGALGPAEVEAAASWRDGELDSLRAYLARGRAAIDAVFDEIAAL